MAQSYPSSSWCVASSCALARAVPLALALARAVSLALAASLAVSLTLAVSLPVPVAPTPTIALWMPLDYARDSYLDPCLSLSPRPSRIPSRISCPGPSPSPSLTLTLTLRWVTAVPPPLVRTWARWAMWAGIAATASLTAYCTLAPVENLAWGWPVPQRSR